jgi:hypothetical protein
MSGVQKAELSQATATQSPKRELYSLPTNRASVTQTCRGNIQGFH